MDRLALERKLLANRIVEGECWIWTGRRHERGYGKVWVTGKILRVHRLAAYLWLGFDLASPDEVCHSCDTPPCFNPAHLFVGTHTDNMRDMAAKGRTKVLRGEAQSQHVLSETDVREMRRRRERGEILASLAAAYGVSIACTSKICRRETWRHLH